MTNFEPTIDNNVGPMCKITSNSRHLSGLGQKYCQHKNQKLKKMSALKEVQPLFVHYMVIDNYRIRENMSVGWDVKWCPVSRITTPLAHKRPFHWISMKNWLVGPPGKLQNFKTDHIKLIIAAVTWLKFCRYGVKLYPIRQLI